MTMTRNRTEPNRNSGGTRTEPNPSNEGSFPSLDQHLFPAHFLEAKLWPHFVQRRGLPITLNFELTLYQSPALHNVAVDFYRAASRTSHEKAVRPSVCLSNAWIVTKQKKFCTNYLYHTKEHLPSFLRRILVGATLSS